MRRVGKALLPHDEYVASLPRKRMAVAALIRDASDRALLVSPVYEGSWLVPGGVVDAGESPHAACRREVKEETGLCLPQGRILAVDWTPQDQDWPEGVFFVYDGGTLSEAGIASIVVPDGELDGFRFAACDEIGSLVDAPLARRIESAFLALRSGSVLSLEHGKPIGLASGRSVTRPLRRGNRGRAACSPEARLPPKPTWCRPGGPSTELPRCSARRRPARPPSRRRSRGIRGE